MSVLYHLLDNSRSYIFGLLEADKILSIQRGVKGQVRNRALDLGILPKKEVPTFTSQKYVPWINWTMLSNTSEGVQDFIGSIYTDETTSFQIVNNTDSILYITGGLPERNALITGPEVIIGPFKASNITLSSPSITILARCYGYDFTSTRSIRGFYDVRGGSAYVEVKGLQIGDNPVLPTMRTSWIRLYDMFDLTLNNPLFDPQITTQAWFSNYLDFSGAVSGNLNVVGSANTVPTAGSNLIGYLSYSGVATGLGNWSAGGTNLVTAVGVNYITNAPLVLSSNKPRAELFFTPGDLTGCQVHIIDLWIAAEITA